MGEGIKHFNAVGHRGKGGKLGPLNPLKMVYINIL